MKYSSIFIKAIAMTALILAAGQAGTATETPDALPGNGTEESPYVIASEEDWTLFAAKINKQEDINAYYELKNDISLGSAESPYSTIVGYKEIVNTKTKYYPFKGHFDGKGHTITLTMSRDEQLAAPFGVVDGATIRNLNVKGTITSTQKYIAGIVAFVYNSTTEETHITNCVSSVDIDCQIDGDSSVGGLVGQNEKGTLNYENCIFEGTITGMTEATEKCGGFMNYANNKVNFTNCIMAGVIGIKNNIATFCRGKATVSYENTYYCESYGGAPSSTTRASKVEPSQRLSRKFKVGETDYFVPGAVVDGIQASYAYTTFPIVVTAEVSFFEQPLEEGTHYALSFQKKTGGAYEDVPSMNEPGEYIVTVKGIGTYAGSYSTTVNVETGASFSLSGHTDGQCFWSTFYDSTTRYTLEEGTLAFTLSEDGKLYRLGENGRVIPAGTAVILISDREEAKLNACEDDTPITDNAPQGNILQGADSDTATSGITEGTVYVLSNEGGALGFRAFTGATIPAGKAYIVK